MRRYRAGDDLETVRNIVNEAFVKSMMTMGSQPQVAGPGVGGSPAGLRREPQHQDTGGGDQLGQRPVEDVHKEGIQVSTEQTVGVNIRYIRLT